MFNKVMQNNVKKYSWPVNFLNLVAIFSVKNNILSLSCVTRERKRSFSSLNC